MLRGMTETMGPAKIPGTREHALRVTKDRHPGVRDALQWLTFAHLPEALQRFSRPFYETAVIMVMIIKTDSPELTTALNKLIEGKDSAVRAGIRHDTGHAGSVPRPQTVALPPALEKMTQDAEAAVARVQKLVGPRPVRDNPQA
jgi:hypothetical protein